MTRCKHARRLAGLTLIEMCVVMAICGVLATLLVPMMLRARSNARGIVCADNLKGLGQAYAMAMSQSNGILPEAYYTFEGHSGTYTVGLKSAEGQWAGTLFAEGVSNVLTCPSDDRPVEVTMSAMGGRNTTIPASYAYNIALPLMFRNGSRIQQPLNMVTFYDGDLSGVVGEWQHSIGWAEETVRNRHGENANFLFLDGHVEMTGDFPESAFEGGSQWIASAFDSRPRLGPDDVEPRPEPGHGVGGEININPGNGNFEFTLVLPDGFTVTRDDLHDDAAIVHDGFDPNYLEYTGPAAEVRVKPKGNGNQNSLTVDGEPYPLENKNRYIIQSNDMTVHLYNDKRNKQGKAMGKWWIAINANEAIIQCQKP